MAFTPKDQNHKLNEVVKDPPMDKEKYQKLVGKLTYLTRTWPNIAYVVSLVSQFMHNPKEVNLQVVHHTTLFEG